MNISLEIGMYVIAVVLVHIGIFVFVMRRKPKNIVGRHVVITGGSKGIGLCLAVECAMKGANVTVIARDSKVLSGAVALMEVIKQVPNQKFLYRSLDISSNYDNVAKVLNEIEEELGEIYMLINCAGLAICGVFEEVPVEDVRKLMEINYFGTYYCTRYVLPKMKRSREGIIVITASQAALFGIYGYGPYAASKFALRGMAETIAMESRHLGVSVTLALPADTNTPGFKVEEETKPLETKIISSGGGLAQPEAVAKQILNDALVSSNINSVAYHRAPQVNDSQTDDWMGSKAEKCQATSFVEFCRAVGKKGNFISILGAESWLLAIVGGGLFRWEGFLQSLLHAFLLGPLRIFSWFLHLHFERIIKGCTKEKLH